MDPNGKERSRLEGYLKKDDFNAFLIMGLARVAFSRKDWPAAEQYYSEARAKFPRSQFAAEAAYWEAVTKYKAGSPEALGAVAKFFQDNYKDSIWAEKSLPWLR
ncbi:MAG: hypothetical protein UZ17_ACD001002539 [Acidobacteria bacterium OLB17]|nr:MAG: hypothetical protein UZ17_ACD001002539 [Acidobacteria bacterium OLB17]MCZ2390262.1 hypothetical protein [Acidobacteriota bacterium]